MSDNVHVTKNLLLNLRPILSHSHERKNTKDTAQLAIFIHGVTRDLQVCEESLQLSPHHGITSGQDIVDVMLQRIKQHSLNLSCLMCMKNNGTPLMTGNKRGAILLLFHYCETAGHTQLIHKEHCIHQEALCAKSVNLVDIMFIVVKIINFILSTSPTALTITSSKH